jgi:hypothetical protein
MHTVSPVSLLDDSCRLEPVRRGARPLREVVRGLSHRRAQPSVVLLVVGSQTPPAELRAVATLFNHDTVFTAIRADAGGEAVLRRSGPVTVASVTTLRELPLMLSRLGTRQ